MTWSFALSYSTDRLLVSLWVLIALSWCSPVLTNCCLILPFRSTKLRISPREANRWDCQSSSLLWSYLVEWTWPSLHFRPSPASSSESKLQQRTSWQRTLLIQEKPEKEDVDQLLYTTGHVSTMPKKFKTAFSLTRYTETVKNSHQAWVNSSCLDQTGSSHHKYMYSPFGRRLMRC